MLDGQPDLDQTFAAGPKTLSPGEIGDSRAVARDGETATRVRRTEASRLSTLIE
jgi:hypothetical protein